MWGNGAALPGPGLTGQVITACPSDEPATHLGAGPEKEHSGLLVVIGAREDGHKVGRRRIASSAIGMPIPSSRACSRASPRSLSKTPL